jgi:hypothetical protein
VTAPRLGFRHADRRFAPLWEGAGQPAARWHVEEQGPAHYFADTPDGAWAEFLRHEGIVDPADLAFIDRALWVMELPEGPYATPVLPLAQLIGDPTSYPSCQAEAARLRAAGAEALVAPSAALVPGGAGGWRVDAGLQLAAPREGTVYVLFGPRPAVVGWRAAEGRPSADVLSRVRHFGVGPS